jgi:phospholipid/cholesterol/gamma-HCH transport system substrate-binding protein
MERDKMRGLISGFTSTRTFREGLVGLLVLLGVGAFGGILLWLNRITPGGNSYKVMVEFANAGGMQKGAPVRYRGVKVGSISKIATGVNAVEVELEINDPKLLIPADSVVEANQSGLISEGIIDINPQSSLATETDIAGPLDQDCNPNLILCHKTSKLQGEIGISVDELIRESANFAERYNNKEFYENVNRLLVTSSAAANSVANLTKELEVISKSFKDQIGTFSNTAVALQKSSTELTTITATTANQLSTTASDFSVTAKQASNLLNNLDELLVDNRSSLISTLNNMNQTSNQLRQTVSSLSPTVDRLTEGELLKNLEVLSANAAEASVNLKDASKNLNDPQNIVLLQQTLDAARGTFENTQKITADLDELTGDPKFRQNLLQLVNGLSKLVSSTKDMQQQAKVAMTLDSLKTSVNKPQIVIKTVPTPVVKEEVINIPPQLFTIKPEAKQVGKPDNKLTKVEISTPPLTSESLPPEITPTPSSQELLLQKLRNYKQQETGKE